MTALERVIQLKESGHSEGEIIATLKAEGVNPLEISDSINQSKIKEAISDPNPTEGMSPSIMADADGPEQAEPPAPIEEPYQPQAAPAYEPAAPEYIPQTEPQGYDSAPTYAQEQPTYNDYDQQAGYDEGYDPQAGYGGMGSTDTMIEVAEQVFLEKMKNLTKEIKALTEFRSIFEIKVDNLSKRLERMEKHFDKMQLSILDKVGEYGKGINYVKKELSMVEDSLSKLR